MVNQKWSPPQYPPLWLFVSHVTVALGSLPTVIKQHRDSLDSQSQCCTYLLSLSCFFLTNFQIQEQKNKKHNRKLCHSGDTPDFSALVERGQNGFCQLLDPPQYVCTHVQTYFITPRLTLCSDCKASTLIYVLVTDVHHPDLWGSMIRPGFCLGHENVVYLYTRRVLGVVKANTGNSIMLCMARMSGALLLYPLTLKQG